MQHERSPKKWSANGFAYVRDEGWPRSPARRRPGERFLAFAVKAPIRAIRWSVRFLAAPFEVRHLQRLYIEIIDAGDSSAPVFSPDGEQGLKRCDIRYINLDQRIDRRDDFEREMRDLGVSWHLRVPATVASPGSLGCGLSHSRVINEWKRSPGRLLFVCEDDAQFVVPRQELDALIDEFVSRPELKILALANRTAWHIPISDRLGISLGIQTTVAYVVKPEVSAQLVELFKHATRLLTDGAPDRVAAIDIAWKELQEQQLFAVPRRRSVIQRSGYSDIQARVVDYYGER